MAMTAVIMKDNMDDMEMLKETILSEAKNAIEEFKTVAEEDNEDDI